MVVKIAHLGPPGTYTEAAALLYAKQLSHTSTQEVILCPYPSNAQTLRAVAYGDAQYGVVPVENSLEGSVTMTLDTLWQLEPLQIQQAIVMPIVHALVSQATRLEQVETVYSHPQALAQCQEWLEQHLPTAKLVAMNSTTEALHHLSDHPQAATISSQRAAYLYHLPILACPINDRPDNCTRFWVTSLEPSPGGTHTSMAFSLQKNAPGALLKPLQVFASRHMNMSRIESRPTKRSLGDYLFFIDLEADARQPEVQSALAELLPMTETLKIFGSYDVVPAEALT